MLAIAAMVILIENILTIDNNVLNNKDDNIISIITSNIIARNAARYFVKLRSIIPKDVIIDFFILYLLFTKLWIKKFSSISIKNKNIQSAIDSGISALTGISSGATTCITGSNKAKKPIDTYLVKVKLVFVALVFFVISEFANL